MVGAGLSKRGAANVDKIMPGISAALLERTKPTAPRIDLSTAENWLLRDEIIELTKDGIRDGLKPHVRCLKVSNVWLLWLFLTPLLASLVSQRICG